MDTKVHEPGAPQTTHTEFTTDIRRKNSLTRSGSSNLGSSPQLDNTIYNNLSATIPNLHKRNDSGNNKLIFSVLKRSGSVGNVPQANANVHNDSPQEAVTVGLDGDVLDLNEPAYLRIVQNYSPIYKEHIFAVVSQLFPDLEVTQECVSILNNFLQDTLVWCVMDSGRHAERDNANSILSCHMQDTLKKLLQATKDPPATHDSSAWSTPTRTPDSTPSSTPDSSSGNLSDVSPPSPLLTSLDAKAAPSLDYIINKRIFLETAQGVPFAPVKQTSYFLLADHALARFSALINDTSRWGTPATQDDVFTTSKPTRGSSLCTKAITVIERSAREIFSVLTDWDHQKRWNNVLYDFRFIEVLDKNTAICYQRYLSKACLVRSERDFCTLLHWFENKEGVCILLAQSVEHEQCPPTNGITRGKINSSGYAVAPLKEGGARVTYCIDVDLVNVPSSVTGIVQRQLNLLPRLRRYMMTGTTKPASPSTLSSGPSPTSSRTPSPTHSPKVSPASSPLLAPSPLLSPSPLLPPSPLLSPSALLAPSPLLLPAPSPTSTPSPSSLSPRRH